MQQEWLRGFARTCFSPTRLWLGIIMPYDALLMLGIDDYQLDLADASCAVCRRYELRRFSPASIKNNLSRMNASSCWAPRFLHDADQRFHRTSGVSTR
jgi:hypothetical protein